MFVKVGPAATLDELILPCPPSSAPGPSVVEPSCWVWLVNLGENGGFFAEKEAEVQALFLSQDCGAVWVPLIGKVSSLARLSLATHAHPTDVCFLRVSRTLSFGSPLLRLLVKLSPPTRLPSPRPLPRRRPSRSSLSSLAPRWRSPR